MRQHYKQVVLAALLLMGLPACTLNTAQSTTAGARERPTARSAVSSAPSTPAVPTPTFVPVNGATGSANAQVIRIDDTAWQGSYRREAGPTTYGGRTATWIYGAGTGYDTMRAEFRAAGQPTGAAQLVIEGMDSEDRAKTPIRIMINDTEIFNGPNPLPNDDMPIETGTWTTATWPFDAALLKPGANTITISTQTPGQFSRPPFFMLDYAEIRYATR